MQREYIEAASELGKRDYRDGVEYSDVPQPYTASEREAWRWGWKLAEDGDDD
jgi:hypothetical protein